MAYNSPAFAGSTAFGTGASPNAGGLTPWQKFGYGATGAGMLGAGLFAPERQNPAQGAMPYLNQIPGMVTPYYQPYINAGAGALPKVQSQFDTLMQNPGDLLKQFGSGYQQSPGYQWNLDQALKGINNSYAAGGMAGSPEHQLQAGQTAAHIADQDYQDYLNRVMNMYGLGLQGQQGLVTGGMNSADMLAQLLGSNAAQKAGLEYNTIANENAAKAQDTSNIFSGLGAIASALLL